MPKQLFAVIRRVTVDADGSPRSYHPDDPQGEGICQTSRTPDGSYRYDGICATDAFPSGSISVFRGAEKLGKSEMAAQWNALWPLIRDRKLASLDLSALAGPSVAEGYYFFYAREKNISALFRRQIIPATHDGYPCMHDAGSPAAGYFVSATTLTQTAPQRTDGCAPAQYIDSEQIPFFVLPAGGFGGVAIGDIVVARLGERVVYGLAADAGPQHRFGEGSIAFNQALLGSSDPVVNVRNVYRLDISGKPVSVLVLGGTKALFNGDYSRRNVEQIAQREFSRWNGGDTDPFRRFNACANAAGAN